MPSSTVSEHHSFGENEDTAGDYAEELAAEMLATTLGLDFDPDKSWDEKKESIVSNQIVRTQNVTQTAVGDKKGLWTTVVAAAVLVGTGVLGCDPESGSQEFQNP